MHVGVEENSHTVECMCLIAFKDISFISRLYKCLRNVLHVFRTQVAILTSGSIINSFHKSRKKAWPDISWEIQSQL